MSNSVKMIENIEYSKKKDSSHMLDLYYPEENGNGMLLFYFHGGGLESGDKKDQKGLYLELAGIGYTVVSANYRMYPEAVFPNYIEDAAEAVAWGLTNVKNYISYQKVAIGGISAGSYISMMLHFNPEYLKTVGVMESEISAYIFDAGQPTTHYNVLKERGMDPTSVRVDEAAPIYFISGEGEKPDNRHYLIIVSDNDIKGRKEQNELLIQTMKTHQYANAHIEYHVMEGFEHAQYVDVVDGNGHYPYADILGAFLLSWGRS